MKGRFSIRSTLLDEISKLCCSDWLELCAKEDIICAALIGRGTSTNEKQGFPAVIDSDAVNEQGTVQEAEDSL